MMMWLLIFKVHFSSCVAVGVQWGFSTSTAGAAGFLLQILCGMYRALCLDFFMALSLILPVERLGVRSSSGTIPLDGESPAVLRRCEDVWLVWS